MRRLFLFSFIGVVLFLSSCRTVDIYEERKVPYYEPNYETRQIPYEVPVYETIEVPYDYSFTETEKETYTVKEYIDKVVPVEPRIVTSKKIAVIPFSGVTPTTTWQAISNFQLGFSSTEENLFYPPNPSRKMEFIPRISLISVLTETELIDLGPSAIKTLKDKFGVDWICTASILKSSGFALELQIVDTEGRAILSGLEGVFQGSSWEDIGKQVAIYLLAPRSKIEQVLEDVTKFREVPVTKTETRYREESIEVGSETRYKSEKIQVGTVTKYRTEKFITGTKQEPIWGIAIPAIGVAAGSLIGLIISSAKGDIWLDEILLYGLLGGGLGVLVSFFVD